MERIVIVNCAVLLTITLCLEAVSAVPHNYETAVEKDRSGEKTKDFPYLWFGPRAGRKKRTPGDDYNSNKYSDLEKEQIATLLDVIQESPWAIVAVNEGKRHTVGFTPRLGRESGEELINNDRYLQDPEINAPELMAQRSPPFAPRLGRRLSPYSPRLGRENDKITQ